MDELKPVPAGPVSVCAHFSGAQGPCSEPKLHSNWRTAGTYIAGGGGRGMPFWRKCQISQLNCVVYDACNVSFCGCFAHLMRVFMRAFEEAGCIRATFLILRNRSVIECKGS